MALVPRSQARYHCFAEIAGWSDCLRVWRWLGFVLVLPLLFVVWGAAWLLWGLPDPRGLMVAAPPPSVLILDRHGVILRERPVAGAGLSRPRSLEEIPWALQAATIAVEDAHFYSHPGLDLRGIARAAYSWVRTSRAISGGSTLTQQVVRNLLLKDERFERTLRRKAREAVLALLVEAMYSKKEILALYLNTTYYGRQAYGVEAAARAFFGKSLEALNLAECAFLAGLPQAPSLYDPAVGLAWKERQLSVLALMQRRGFIGPAEAALAARTPLQFVRSGSGMRAPHFVAYVESLAEGLVGQAALRRGGLRIFTTLDVALQERAQQVLQEHLRSLERTRRAGRELRVRNGAIVVLDVATGDILVMVGSPDYDDAGISGAVNGALALRQPGSAIKPITYAAAFEQGFSPGSVFSDEPATFLTAELEPYQPVNFDGRFHGRVTLREALASSYNVVAVKVLNEIGLPAMLDMAGRLGITSLRPSARLGLAATLGGGEVSLLELTTAYAVFARGGRYVAPRAIVRIEDAQGHVLWQAPEASDQQVLPPQVAYLITDILSDGKARLPGFGEAWALSLDRPAAVKTGTTTDCRDNWTIGYTPQIAVGVWVGNADGQSMGRISGVEGAAPVWHDVMLLAHRALPPMPFARPDGIVERIICPESGLLAGPECPHARRELFIVGTEPTEQCPLHAGQALAALRGSTAGGQQESETVIAFLSPPPNSSYMLAPDVPESAQQLLVEVQAPPKSLLRLKVDGQPLAELKQPPYRVFWPLSLGRHVLVAEAVGEDGEVLLPPAVVHLAVHAAGGASGDVRGG